MLKVHHTTSFTPSDQLTAKDIRRFLVKVVEGTSCICRGAPHSCWLWMSQIIKTGDGLFRVGTTHLKAQEVAYIAMGNSLNPADTLRRMCSTRGCCNPACMQLSPKRQLMRKGFREGPLQVPYGQGGQKAPRSALQPGAVTRREWLRFVDKVIDGESCHCIGQLHRHWLWQPVLHSSGYGHFWWRGNIYPAHRFAVIALGRIISAGYEPDHLCRVRHCVNPACIEVVTKKVNTLRGMGMPAQCARKTHCPQGHPLEGGNLVPNRLRRGERTCRLCKNARERAAYARKKQA